MDTQMDEIGERHRVPVRSVPP